MNSSTAIAAAAGAYKRRYSVRNASELLIKCRSIPGKILPERSASQPRNTAQINAVSPCARSRCKSPNSSAVPKIAAAGVSVFGRAAPRRGCAERFYQPGIFCNGHLFGGVCSAAVKESV